jgi:ABC-type sugar transport system ATPase subunit
MVEIVRALSSNASIIVLDEPTAALTAREKGILFGFIQSLRGRATFIYISHYLEEVFEVCERVTVLRDGESVGTYQVGELTPAHLTQLIIGQDVHFVQSPGHSAPEVVLSVRGVTRRGAFDAVSFDVRRGEILGITGLTGSGKSELARAIFGLEPLDGGTVLVGGQPAHITAPADALALGVAYLPEDRRRYGLVPIFSVSTNIALAAERRVLGPLGFLSRRKERLLGEEYVGALGIVTPSLDQQVQFLSGGNQQKVVVSKLLALQPRVLLLDDPARGVDVGAKAEIFAIIERLSRAGMVIVMISDEVLELLTLCERILVMNRGRVTHEFWRGQATYREIVLAMEGATDGAAEEMTRERQGAP